MRERTLRYGALSLWLLTLSLLAPGIASAKLPVATAPILVVGDSLSAAHNIPVQSGWVTLLDQRLKRDMATPPPLVNTSISGETTSGALTRLPGLLENTIPASW